MSKTSDHPTPRADTERTSEVRQKYCRPCLERLGLLREIARMPTGTGATEGASGKRHPT